MIFLSRQLFMSCLWYGLTIYCCTSLLHKTLRNSWVTVWLVTCQEAHVSVEMDESHRRFITHVCEAGCCRRKMNSGGRISEAKLSRNPVTTANETKPRRTHARALIKLPQAGNVSCDEDFTQEYDLSRASTLFLTNRPAGCYLSRRETTISAKFSDVLCALTRCVNFQLY
jgi:hypothetical protein